MKIIKKINTSAALAQDSTGKEVVVFGKGIGFPQMPYELEDLSRIERTFYDIDPRYYAMVAELPQNIVMASADIAELAEVTLNCRLNPNLPFTLADHLSFAVERLRTGMDLGVSIAYDVRHLYPREAQLGEQALDILAERTGVVLPESEAVRVAMHFINAEAESGSMHDLAVNLKIIGEINRIVEKELGIVLDKDSYSYSRFVMHLQYLIQRLSGGAQTEEQNGEILDNLVKEYPQIYNCALKVRDYLRDTWGWECSRAEILYLMLHINRVKTRLT